MHLDLKNKIQSELVRNSARLLSANIVAQAIGLLVYPILTRIYSPDDFGLLNLFLSIGGVLVLLSTADYQNAIVLPKQDKSARAIVQVCIALLLSMVVLLLLTIPFSRPIASLFKAPDLARWWWLMPLYVLALGGWQIVRNYLLRHKAFNDLSGYQYSQSLLSTGGKLVFGATGFLSGGLITASVLGPLLSFCISISVAWKKVFHKLLHIDKGQCTLEARNYHNFPRYSLPRTIVNYLSGNLPVLMLTPVFGLTEMGFFGLALTLSFIPINMIVQSIYQVLYQRTAQLVNDRQRIGRLLFAYAAQSAIVLVPFFAVLYFVLPWLTGWLLGTEWCVSGEYIRLMLPWLLMTGIVSPISFLTDVFAKQKQLFVIELLYLFARIGALALGVTWRDFRLALLLYSLVSTIVWIGQLAWFVWLIRRHDRAIG